ncbi:MAG: ABC transporter permease subunit [Propionivibrio sp.]
MAEPILPVAQWVNELAHHLLGQGTPSLDSIGQGLSALAEVVQRLLTSLPPAVSVAVFAILGLWRSGWRLGVFAALALLTIHGMGFGDQLMVTLAQIITATLIAILIGVPLGIWLGGRPLATRVVRPLLDLMQTMPAFVYLIPATMLFGLGLAPALLATVIFSLPPVVRLTTMGIHQVEREVVEAATCLGATPQQSLLLVKLPYAMPAIMAGVSQTIMMALSMVIIASMVGAGGLGNEVLSAIQRLDIGQGLASGLSVVLLAMVVDRLTESFAPKTPVVR